MRETPSISSSAYTSTTTTGMMLAGGAGGTWLHPPEVAERRIQNLNEALKAAGTPVQLAAHPKEKVMGARIVKVYIADPNENIELANRVLYSGEEKLTDLTDQELFFEVPIADLLTKHNALRKDVVDKAQSDKFGRDIKLEAVRIRDLKMVVVTVAQF